MEPRPDLSSAASHLASLVERVPDDALDRPTPCEGYAVRDLLAHIGGLAVGFRTTAVKRPVPPPAQGEDLRLDDGWRAQIPRDLQAMADAWAEPSAWEGMTEAGGVALPGEVAGLVGLGELVIHGWDLARATGGEAYDGPELAAVLPMAEQFQELGPDGPYGPRVAVSDDAPLLDRILGATGREPGWRLPA
ncbi:MAG TPA: TIGR03086 family metal-binding protein [Aquihabitans sp.]|nr:TIGR03086 family metal-binding protein [Aquihabitans sp.]